MTQASPPSPLSAFLRFAAWLTPPLLAAGALRLLPAVTLPSSSGEPGAWLVPVFAGLLALAGAAAALRALAATFRDEGSASAALDAAAAGSLTAAATAVALAGPAAASTAPGLVLSVGALTAAAPLVAAPLVSDRPLSDRPMRLIVGALVFVWIELAPALGLLAGARLESVAAAAVATAAVLAFVAALVALITGATARVGWTSGVASGILALAIARTGSADALPGLLGIAAALVGMALWSPVDRRAPSAGEPRLLGPVDTSDGMPAAGFVAEDDEARRLARELRGTIAELLAARTTVDLQRREIEELAQVDPDTGVATRRAILGRLHAEAAEARRYAHPIAIVLIDLDGLTELNGRHGIPVGDAVLRELALRLRLRIREADAIGRLTGDTFMAILPHTDERGVTVFADAIRTRLTLRPVDTNAGPIAMTVSIGITTLRAGISDADDDQLLARAEEALASARAAGGNRIAFDRQHGLARLDEGHADQGHADQGHGTRGAETERA